jgi:hypothetical protein
VKSFHNICIICTLLLTGCSIRSEDLHRAEVLAREGRYDEAIAAYREHMQSRLQVTDRPEWENPYFYLILIGDVQLSRGDPLAALTLYQEAELKLASCQDPEAKSFHESLLSDRYRAVATWYMKHDQLQQALELLQRHRARDPLIFDAHLDRVARTLTAKEQREAAAAAAAAAASQAPVPPPSAQH